MTRGKGKNVTRTTPAPEPNTAAGRDIGLSDRQTGDRSPIPGGRPHLSNAPSVRRSVPTTAPRPEFRGVMAHGVPPGPGTAHDRAESMRGPNSAHDPRPRFSDAGNPPPPPVPVYVVQKPNSHAPILGFAPRRYVVPAAGSEPIHLVGKNSDREELLLLNEDANHAIFFSNEKASVQQAANLPAGETATSVGTLPKGMTGYLKLPTQGDVWVVSADSGTPVICALEVAARDGGQRQ